MNETPDRREDAAPEEPKRNAQDPRRENMRRIIMVVAGGYLIYLGVQLAMMYAQGTAEGSGRIVSLIAAIVFIPFGAITLVLNLRAAFRNFRTSIAALDDYEDEEDTPEALEAPDEDDAPEALEAPDEDAPDEEEEAAES